MMTIEIAVAQTDAEYARFGELIREYWDWLVERYAARPGLMERIGDEQGLAAELASLPQVYGPPEGRTLLAMIAGDVVGGVAYHDLHDGTAEMKRLYVRPAAQGQGLGRRLTCAVIEAAASDGYSRLRLDTGVLNTEAIRMYEALGFERAAPYRIYPPEILEHLLIMELQLGG